MQITRRFCVWIDCKETATQSYGGLDLCLRHQLTAAGMIRLGIQSPFRKLSAFVKPFARQSIEPGPVPAHTQWNHHPNKEQKKLIQEWQAAAGGVAVPQMNLKSVTYVPTPGNTEPGSRDLSETRFLFGRSFNARRRNWND